MVGNYKESNGLPGYAVALIVIFSLLAVGGVVGFLCWKFGLHKKVIDFFKSFIKGDKGNEYKIYMIGPTSSPNLTITIN